MVFRRRFYSNPSLEEPVEPEVSVPVEPEVSVPVEPEVSVPVEPEVSVPVEPVEPESLDVEVLPKAPKRPSKAKKTPVAE